LVKDNSLETWKNQFRAVLKGPRALDEFCRLYGKFKQDNEKIQNWEAIQSPDLDHLKPYDSLPDPSFSESKAILSHIAVCKLNGGLGTSMGCKGPKSAIPVRENFSFLDLIVRQLVEINARFDARIPLILMNSFYTHADMERLLSERHEGLKIHSMVQNRFPRLRVGDETPLPEAQYGLDAWYPPGHGDFFSCIVRDGLLDRLLAEGKEIVFVSNADNLGAVVDPRIAGFLLGSDIPLLIEMTPKTPADIKGGTLYQVGVQLKLLEIARVPAQNLDEFCGQTKFKVFNTNNVWVNLRHLKQALENGPLDLSVLVNRKRVEGVEVIQLETAIGSALECFERSRGITVSRERFLPVKTTDDLLLLQSDLFILQGAFLKRNPGRQLPELPRIRLGDRFALLDDYLKRVPEPLSLLELESLEIEGDVRFEGEAILKGRVRLIAREIPLRVPAGSVLDNQTLEQ